MSGHPAITKRTISRPSESLERGICSLILDNSVTAIQLVRSLADGQSCLGGLLLGQSNLLFVGSSDIARLLHDVELNMAVGCQVRRDSSVSSVSSSSSLDSSLGADVGDLASLGVETLGLSVGLEVQEQRLDVSAGLLGESTVVMADVFAHSMSSGASCESSEGNDGLVLHDLIHVLDGLQEVESSARSGSLVSVLEMSSQVIHSARSSYKNRSVIAQNLR